MIGLSYLGTSARPVCRPYDTLRSIRNDLLSDQTDIRIHRRAVLSVEASVQHLGQETSSRQAMCGVAVWTYKPDSLESSKNRGSSVPLAEQHDRINSSSALDPSSCSCVSSKFQVRLLRVILPPSCRLVQPSAR